MKSFEISIAKLSVGVDVARRGRKVRARLVLFLPEEDGPLRSDTIAAILQAGDGDLIRGERSPQRTLIPVISTSSAVGSAEVEFQFPIEPHRGLRRLIVVVRGEWSSCPLD
jgi:hypothetical protein